MLKYSRSCAGAEHLQEALSSILGILKAVNDSMHLIAITGYDVRASVCRHRARDGAEPCRSLPVHARPCGLARAGSDGCLGRLGANGPPAWGVHPNPGRRLQPAELHVRSGAPRALDSGLGWFRCHLWVGDGTSACERQTLFFPCVPE